MRIIGNKMNEKLILRQEKYALIQLMAYLWVIFMAVYGDTFNQPLIGIGMVLILGIFVYFSFYAVEIVIGEKGIKRGNKLPFVKNRFKQVEVQRMGFQGVKINQTTKKYFEIYVLDTNGNRITLAVLPNRLPAEEKKREFDAIITSYWNTKT